MADRRYRIAGDVVNKATADLPDDQRSSIRWLHAHAAENNLNLDEVGKLIRYDETTVYRVLTGKYEGNLANVCREIDEFRKLHDERQKGRKLQFIETAMTRKIWRVCEAALEYQRVAFVFGETQVGKTEALREYARTHNHGSTVYVEMPTGGALVNFMAKLCKALRISTQLKYREMRRRLIESFDDRMLLIVDECHRCIRDGDRGTRSLEPIDFCREIFDSAKCGLVLCATNVFREAMDESGSLISGILKQTKRRRLCALQLPAVPTNDDLKQFAAAYGLSPATGEALTLQSEVIRDEALGMWLTLLRMASKIAHQRGKKLGWEHVIAAHAGLRSLEGR